MKNNNGETITFKITIFDNVLMRNYTIHLKYATIKCTQLENCVVLLRWNALCSETIVAE